LELPLAGRVNDFETSFLILYRSGLCLCQFFSRNNTAGILAISTTLFGLMYVPWLLIHPEDLLFPKGNEGQYPLFPNGVEGKYYLLYLHPESNAKFSDSGRVCTRLAPSLKAQDDSTMIPGQDVEGIGFARYWGSTVASLLFCSFRGLHLGDDDSTRGDLGDFLALPPWLAT